MEKIKLVFEESIYGDRIIDGCFGCSLVLGLLLGATVVGGVLATASKSLGLIIFLLVTVSGFVFMAKSRSKEGSSRKRSIDDALKNVGLNINDAIGIKWVPGTDPKLGAGQMIIDAEGRRIAFVLKDAVKVFGFDEISWTSEWIDRNGDRISGWLVFTVNDMEQPTIRVYFPTYQESENWYKRLGIIINGKAF